MAQMSTSDLPRIGDVIRAWRIFRGLRSTELAAKAGVRSQYLSEIEHNRTNNPKEDYLQKLANALGVPLKDILGRGMPPKDGGMVTTPSSKQGVARQAGQQVSADEEEDIEEAEEEEELETSTAAAALGILDSLLDPLGDELKEIKRLIDSASLTDEQEEVVAFHLDTLKRLLKLFAAQGMMRKED